MQVMKHFALWSVGLAEAMASGMPPVCTNGSGMKDVIREGESGLLIPVQSPDALVEAIHRLRADGALRERLGRAAHETARRVFRWERNAQPILRAYERLGGLAPTAPVAGG